MEKKGKTEEIYGRQEKKTCHCSYTYNNNDIVAQIRSSYMQSAAFTICKAKTLER